jgi:Protein of unknown function
MTPEEQTVVDTLAPDFVAQVDAAILSHAASKPRKVAMIVGMAMSDPALRRPGLSDLFYVQRVKALVAKGHLVADGNLDYMRYSEVRLS